MAEGGSPQSEEGDASGEDPGSLSLPCLHVLSRRRLEQRRASSSASSQQRPTWGKGVRDPATPGVGAPGCARAHTASSPPQRPPLPRFLRKESLLLPPSAGSALQEDLGASPLSWGAIRPALQPTPLVGKAPFPSACLHRRAPRASLQEAPLLAPTVQGPLTSRRNQPPHHSALRRDRDRGVRRLTTPLSQRLHLLQEHGLPCPTRGPRGVCHRVGGWGNAGGIQGTWDSPEGARGRRLTTRGRHAPAGPSPPKARSLKGPRPRVGSASLGRWWPGSPAPRSPPPIRSRGPRPKS